ncbi:MAG TPA: lysylphosphatidylglycerol synthase domain-containing protein [Fontimonas sp.]
MSAPIVESASRLLPPRARRSGRQRLWQIVTLIFVVLIVGLLADKARDMDWQAVGAALRAYEMNTLLVAAGLALAAHVAAASYDIVAKHYVGHRLPAPRVFAINFIAYAFSINFGGLVGGWGMRMRLYHRFGLAGRQIAQIIGLAFLTNWSGYVLLAALVLCMPLTLPVELPLEQPVWRLSAAMLLFAVLASYLALCAIGHARGWRLRIRQFSLRLPRLRIALLQIALSSASWLLMAATLDRLLPAQVPFEQVVLVLLLGSIVGAISHVPGSVGVLEASVIWLFAGQAEQLNVLAALLAYRALFYLLPLLLAALGFAGMEWLARRHRARGLHLLASHPH